jgi:hypothetical protein
MLCKLKQNFMQTLIIRIQKGIKAACE